MKRIILVLAVLMIFGSVYGQGCMEASSEEGVNVVGYIQAQYNYMFQNDDEEIEPVSSFTFKRVRFGLIGNIPYDISYYSMFEFSPNQENTPFLLDGFITYSRLAPYLKVSMGQFKSPFSLELNTPCQKLHTINRSNVTGALASPLRDRGLLLSGGYKKWLKYNFAITNGTGLQSAENNYEKDYHGRIVFMPVDFISFGGSFGMRSMEPATEGSDENDTMNLFAGELEIKYKDFLVQAEYITADHESSGGTIEHPGDCSTDPWTEILPAGTTTKAGYWLQAMYMSKWNLQPVVKFEYYDPNTDEDNLNEDNCVKKITTFGLNYFLNDWTRLQLNYLYKAEEKYEYSNDEILFQVQVTF